MKKISTLFVVDYSVNPDGEITDKVRPENQWVYDELDVVATRKWDGTACAIIGGELYKRYDVKPTKKAFKDRAKKMKYLIPYNWVLDDFNTIPEHAIPCQDADMITGHWPHWVKCDRNNPQDKYFWEGYDTTSKGLWLKLEDATYELIGEKVGTNPENIKGHLLIQHGVAKIDLLMSFSFEDIKTYLSNLNNNIEGIVFYGSDDKKCKIRKKDFGIKR